MFSGIRLRLVAIDQTVHGCAWLIKESASISSIKKGAGIEKERERKWKRPSSSIVGRANNAGRFGIRSERNETELRTRSSFFAYHVEGNLRQPSTTRNETPTVLTRRRLIG